MVFFKSADGCDLTSSEILYVTTCVVILCIFIVYLISYLHVSGTISWRLPDSADWSEDGLIAAMSVSGFFFLVALIGGGYLMRKSTKSTSALRRSIQLPGTGN